MIDVAKTLALGTAQLGMRYGVANDRSQHDPRAALGLVQSCWEEGIRFFDTAQAYGDSERLLGDSFRELGISDDVFVMTKLHPDLADADAAAIRDAALASRAVLGGNRLWGLMLHREELLDSWSARWGPAFSALKGDGVVAYVGVSVSTPYAAMRALDIDAVDILQVPANVFDRRMQRRGVFDRARELGKTVFVRSVYLQGLVVIEPNSVPAAIPGAADAVSAYRRFCEANRVEPRQFAIDYALDRAPDSILVIGADNADQAKGNCEAVSQATVATTLCNAWDEVWPEDFEELVDPSLWPPTIKEA